ncbi:Formate-dependent phosphoribosylglycinamide formyltransferase [Castellaniella defragrans]
MSEVLLVLGASLYQVPIITAAQKLGYLVATTDNVPSNPGHRVADISHDVDTTDLEEVLGVAIKEKISGVISPGTDVAVSTAAYVAEQLGLPGPSFDAANTLTHKLMFREFQVSSGMECPRFFRVTEGVPPGVASFTGQRWIVKPNRSSGSKGVFVVDSQAELLARAATSAAFSKDGAVIVEEFVEGTQHTCEGVIRGGKVEVSLLTDRDTAAAPYTTTVGHRVPSYLSSPTQRKVLAAIERVLQRLDVRDGPFDCDFVVDGERIVLIEITPRLGGNSLSELFRVATGFDLAKYAVMYACGSPYPLSPCDLPRSSAIRIFGAEQQGRLRWNESEFERLARESWIHTLLLDVPLGALVEPYINGRHRFGEALVTGVNRHEVDARVLELSRRLAFVTT